MEVLGRRVSYQANAWSSLSKEMTIHDALIEIKSDKYKQQVNGLRILLQNGKKEDYNSHKKNLPAVTFCGTFDIERKKAKLKSYNSLVVLDIDKLEANEFERIKKCFQNDQNVFAYWESPSKEGIKGLVTLHYNFELNADNIDRAHKSSFQKLSGHFRDTYAVELDSSGSDTTRLCFFSYDSDLVLKGESSPFEIAEVDLLQVVEPQRKLKNETLVQSSQRDALFNPMDRNKPSDRYTMSAIIRFLEKKKLSITNSYEEWYKVAMAVANSFTYEVGEKYFIKLSSFDKVKYKEINCKNFLLNCYETRNGAIRFNSIVYFANEKGYSTKIQRDRGSEAVGENLSQVSSLNTVCHSPEDLKE